MLLRWLVGQPLRGDFEIVSLAVGVGIFACMPWATRQRAHVGAAGLTAWLPARAQAALDALWLLLFAAVLWFLAARLAVGALDAWRDNMRSMGLLGLPIFWAVGFGAFCFLLAGVAALPRRRR